MHAPPSGLKLGTICATNVLLHYNDKQHSKVIKKREKERWLPSPPTTDIVKGGDNVEATLTRVLP